MISTPNGFKEHWIYWGALLALTTLSPFLVLDTTFKVRMSFFALWILFLSLCLLVWIFNRKNSAVELTKLEIELNKRTPAMPVILLIALLLLISIANAELFPSGIIVFLKNIALTAQDYFPLLSKYQTSYNLGLIQQQSPSLNETNLLKNQISTITTLSLGLVFSVGWLLQHFQRSGKSRAMSYKSGSRQNSVGLFVFLGGIVLSVFAFYTVFTGNIELDPEPPRRAICLMILSCYGGDALLILLAAILKPVMAYMFALAMIFSIDQIFLELKDF